MLQGEGVEFLGRAADALIAISNYRLHIKFKDSVINVSSCLVLPHPSHNPCEIQGGTVSAPFGRISQELGFPSFSYCLLAESLSVYLFHSPPPLLSFLDSVAGPSRGTVT